MAFDSGTDNDQIRSLQVQIGTARAQMDRLTERVAMTREALCAREKSDGSFEINFDALVEKLGLAACLQLRAAIDERWSVSGEAGAKPRVKVRAA